MADVRMVTDTGDAVDVHPDDREKALALGWTEAAEPSATRVARPGAGEPNYNPDWARAGVGAIPAVGGAIGGLLGAAGGPAGAIGGAASGGAGGELIRQVVARRMGMETPGSPGEIAKQAVTRGGEQALYQAGGLGLAAGLRGAGTSMMRAALRAPRTIEQKAIAAAGKQVGRASPEDTRLAAQALRERVPVGARPLIGGRPGSEVVNEKIAAAASALDDVLADAWRSGKRFNVLDFTGRIGELRAALGREATPIKALERLDKMVNEFVAVRRAPRTQGRIGRLIELTPQEANTLKRTWQEAANAIYKARERGALVPPRQALAARFNQTVAQGAREALETIPGVAPLNARMASLMPLREAVQMAEMRGPALHPGLPFLPDVVNWAFVPRALSMPPVMSRMALTATHPALLAAAGQAPRAAGAMLLPPQMTPFQPDTLPPWWIGGVPEDEGGP